MKHWFSERLNISSCYKEPTCRSIARFGGMIEVLAANVTYGIHKKELINYTNQIFVMDTLFHRLKIARLHTH